MIGLKNINIRQGIYYDDVYLSFSNSFNKSPLLMANYTIPRSYQGHEKRAKKWGQAQPFDNQTTQLKYKFMFWKTRTYRFEASVNLEVNEDGATKVKDKLDGIKMKKSDSSTRLTSLYLCVLMNLIVFLAIR
ncbi:unnamed protein product [Arabis nemorensis]|uniref:Uncharacterized protein n=1 Tax=Arabis nemorensis TaxID=586526 RepID=A0A565BC90_9BRAS|nr:unnamed protein product [Arabis nemorensis]